MKYNTQKRLFSNGVNPCFIKNCGLSTQTNIIQNSLLPHTDPNKLTILCFVRNKVPFQVIFKNVYKSNLNWELPKSSVNPHTGQCSAVTQGRALLCQPLSGAWLSTAWGLLREYLGVPLAQPGIRASLDSDSLHGWICLGSLQNTEGNTLSESGYPADMENCSVSLVSEKK